MRCDRVKGGLLYTVHCLLSQYLLVTCIYKNTRSLLSPQAAHEAAKQMSWDQKNLTLGKYGPYWRNMRKLCTLELLNSSRINSFQPMRKEELDLLIECLKEATRDGDSVDLTAKIAALSANMSCRMVLEKKYMDDEFDEKGFKAVMQEGMYLAATPNLGDCFPFNGALDLQGLDRRMKAVAKTFDDFFEKIIDEHVHHQSNNNKDKKTKDFVDVLLGFLGTKESEYCIERPNIKAIMLDMLGGSMDTSATAIKWTMSELMKNPGVMKKVQKELEIVVGMERKVEESDLENLEYLNMVIKESLRLHPVAPLLAPHESVEDCTVGDYFIPAKSRVIINAWAIMRDPSAWSEPDRFWPERFEGRSVDLRGHDFELFPLGCPGLQLDLTVIRLVVAQLVHCFDRELPRGMWPSDLDMTEEFGLTMPRVNQLVAVPIRYRFKC